MNYIRIAFVVSLLLVVLTGRSEPAENKLESWYTFWSLGASKITWPTELNDAMDLLETMPGVSRTSVMADVFGFYKPINPHMIGGVVINGASDRIEVGGEFMELNLFTYAVSAQYFREEIGTGVFGRVDIGLAMLNMQASGQEDDNLDPGFGFLVGGGYAYPVTPGNRVTLNLNYDLRRIEGESVKTLGITLGGLF
tara:strand:- start:782 stop:1369 length:588 start_codon:yes stop_codon:yes gene_type:complete